MNSKSKKLIKRIAIIIIFLLIIPFWIHDIYWLAVPLSRSNDDVRSYFLRHFMPIDTSWDDANAIIAEKGWGVRVKSEEQGVVYDLSSHRPIMYVYEPEDELPSSKIRIGSKYIYCYLGDYWAIFDVSVKAALAFDDNDRLIEVVIQKEWDTL